MGIEVWRVVVGATGIAGVGVLTLLWLFRSLVVNVFATKFPILTQEQAYKTLNNFMLIIAVVTVLCLVVSMVPSVLGMVYERQVDLVLRDEKGHKIAEKFTFDYKIGARTIQSARGENGSAPITGVPWGVGSLTVDVQCPGYDQVHKEEPYTIEGGIVTVKMVSAQKLKPKTTSLNVPQIPTFTEAEKSDFSKPPKAAPSKVTFWRRNLTTKPLTLILYDCTEPNGVPNAKSTLSTGGRLSTWPLKMGPDGEFSKPFSKGNGCFYLWVRDESDEWPLGLRNLFDDLNAYVTIRETGEKDRPYSGDFSSWSTEINVPPPNDAAATDVREPSSIAGSDSDQK